MDKGFKNTKSSILMREQRIPLSERILFYSRLALYLRSGIPIRVALGFMASSAKGKVTQNILRSIDEAILQGTPLSRALSTFPMTFPSFETNLVEIAEKSGSLSENLTYLALLLMRRRSLSRKIKSAFLYPLMIVIGTFGVTGFLILYTFPKIVPIFRGLDVPLPFSTRFLLALSDLIAGNGLLLFVTLCVVGACAVYAARIPRISSLTQSALLKIPVMGSLLQKYNLAVLARTLSTLLSSGISLIPALVLLGNSIRHSDYREAINRIANRVSEGQRLSSEIRKEQKLFPNTFVELIAAGESTGSLSSSLTTAALLYEEELEDGTNTLTTLIEPILMIAMGLLVGFIAMAIITPIYGITQNLTSH